MTNTMVSKLTDEELAHQFKATADQIFFGEIYKRYFPQVYRICLGILKDSEIARDLAQDVMIRVMEKLPNLHHEFLLRVWVRSIARNESITYYNKHKKSRLLRVDQCIDLAAEETDMDSLNAQEKLFEGMDRAIEVLNEDMRTMLNLKYLHNTSIKELQHKFTLSESAVKMRLARARERVAEVYDQSQRISRKNAPSFSI